MTRKPSSRQRWPKNGLDRPSSEEPAMPGSPVGNFLTGHYGPNWEDLKTMFDLVQPYVRMRMYGLPDWEANTPGFDNDGKSGGDDRGQSGDLAAVGARTGMRGRVAHAVRQ